MKNFARILEQSGLTGLDLAQIAAEDLRELASHVDGDESQRIIRAVTKAQKLGVVVDKENLLI